ncbi:myeloid differentiation primary response protein MyD88-like isoform X2 [Ptychodera flava]|uniref:myeloid differentiation primary response protein MyD88-like isoform X2 n=1 Tax=Ptychodera flava TaxID=63121 RepID=UPI003969F38B
MAEPNDWELIDLSCYSDFPVRHLRQRTRNILSRSLNVNLRGKDWRDVADEMEYDYITILKWEREQNPMGCFLRDWDTKESSTVGKLIDVLEDLGRQDVISEIKKPLDEDHNLWRRGETEGSPLLANEFISQQDDLAKRSRCITRGDRANDSSIVHTMMSILEKPPYNLKLCVQFRDLVPGCPKVTAEAELITNRCKRMIVILSPEFLGSDECDFQAKIALSLNPGSRAKYVFPVMYKQCTLPPILGHIAVCDYTKADQKEWFWERLYRSLNVR